MAEIPTTRREFEQEIARLTQAAERTADNVGSYKSEGCVRCYDCMFTSDSVQCYQCTYCSACERCTNCTHCKNCRDCHNSNYCVQSHACSGCSYVILSRDCYDCIFCFGCVGLVKKEFHILNQPFRRDEYFKLVKELKKAFGLT